MSMLDSFRAPCPTIRSTINLDRRCFLPTCIQVRVWISHWHALLPLRSKHDSRNIRTPASRRTYSASTQRR